MSYIHCCTRKNVRKYFHRLRCENRALTEFGINFVKYSNGRRKAAKQFLVCTAVQSCQMISNHVKNHLSETQQYK